MTFKVGDFVQVYGTAEVQVVNGPSDSVEFKGPVMKVIEIDGAEVHCVLREEGEMVTKAFLTAHLRQVHPDPFMPAGAFDKLNEAGK